MYSYLQTYAPECPNCRKPTKRQYIYSESTLVHNPIILDEEGKVISNNSNVQKEHWICLNCAKFYMTEK